MLPGLELVPPIDIVHGRSGAAPSGTVEIRIQGATVRSVAAIPPVVKSVQRPWWRVNAPQAVPAQRSPLDASIRSLTGQGRSPSGG